MPEREDVIDGVHHGRGAGHVYITCVQLEARTVDPLIDFIMNVAVADIVLTAVFVGFVGHHLYESEPFDASTERFD